MDWNTISSPGQVRTRFGRELMVESVRSYEQGSILVGKEVKERRIAASLELNESKGVADDATNLLATLKTFRQHLSTRLCRKHEPIPG